MSTTTDTSTGTIIKSPQRDDTNLAAALVVLALVVWSMVDAPSRELGEVVALSRASGRLSEALTHTLLWDALLWAWVHLLDAGSARVLSRVLGAVQIGLIFLTARALLLPRDCAAAAAVLLLLTPATLPLAQDIRPDALLGAVVTAAWGSGLANWRTGWRGWGHGAAVLGAMLVHPLGGVLVLPLALLRPRWMWLVLLPLGLGELLWLETGLRLDSQALLACLRTAAFDEPVTMAGVGLLLVWVHQRSPHRTALAAWLLVPILSVILLGADPRYAAVSLPALWLLVGQGLSGLRVARRWGVISAMVLVGGFSLAHRTAHPLPRGDVDALHAALPALAADDVILARLPRAWTLLLSRPVEAITADAARIERLAGRRVLWLLGEQPADEHETLEALRAATPVLQEVRAGGGHALLLCPGGEVADHSAAVFAPTGARDGSDLLLYVTAELTLPDLITAGPGRYAVDVVGRGSSVAGEAAKLEISVQGAQPEGAWVWSLPAESAVHRVTFSAERSGAVVLRFLNDKTHGSEDRNIWIEQVVLSKLESHGQQR